MLQLVAACCKADGRLFAIGEDAGLAALRSAGQALAAEARAGVGTEDGAPAGARESFGCFGLSFISKQVGDGLLQYWTVDATRHGARARIWMHVIYDTFRAKAW